MKPVRNTQEFDRTVCYSCFSTWVDAIRMMAQESPERAVGAFLTLSDYCLYGVQPEPEGNPWGFMWPIVEGEAKRSIANRRRGFGSEDVELSDAIRAYSAEHPDASQRAIADALGCSLGKVNKALQKPAGAIPVTGDGAVTDNVHVNVSHEHSVDGDGLFPHSVNKTECEIFGFPISEEVQA